MKKLIVMAVVAVAAAASQAASFSWQGTYTKDASGAVAADGLPVYLFVASTSGTGYDRSDTVLSAGTWTMAQLTAAVAEGNFLKDGWLDKAVDTAVTSENMYMGNSIEYTGIANGAEVLLAAVFVDSSSKSPDVYAAYLTSEGVEVKLDTLSGVGEWDTGFDSYSNLNYAKQEVVPEPTSGLLLLLGVAGLALRRKQK